jgi:hypothetical protein
MMAVNNDSTRRRPFFLRTLFVAAALLLAGAATLVALAYPRQSEMLPVLLNWGQLAPIPASAQNFAISRQGGMFTRAFRASFSAPTGDIEQSLRDSPGTRDIVPERPAPTTRHYLITPGGGAQHAEVNVDDGSGSVSIYVYWS